MLLAGAFAFALVSFLVLRARIHQPPDPVYSGHPVSYWFGHLCSGVYGGTPRAAAFPAAYAEFSRMDSQAVPYLVWKFRSDPAGFKQRTIVFLKQFRWLAPVTDWLVIPSVVRSYAAVALRQMGPRAESALPALLMVYAKEADADVRLNAITALAAIMGFSPPEDGSPAVWTEFEKHIVAEAERRLRDQVPGKKPGAGR